MVPHAGTTILKPITDDIRSILKRHKDSDQFHNEFTENTRLARASVPPFFKDWVKDAGGKHLEMLDSLGDMYYKFPPAICPGRVDLRTVRVPKHLQRVFMVVGTDGFWALRNPQKANNSKGTVEKSNVERQTEALVDRLNGSTADITTPEGLAAFCKELCIHSDSAIVADDDRSVVAVYLE